MIKSQITVDLPSVESQRRKSLFDSFKELFGQKIDLRDGHEETTVTAFSLLDGVCQAVTRAQINDAISLIVDKKVIYLDTQNVTADVNLLWQAANEKGIYSASFNEMHVAFAHREAGLAVIVDVRVQRRVLVGYAEMQVELSARPEALVVAPGESAATYAERVSQYARDETTLAYQRAALDAVASRLAQELGRTLPGSRVSIESAKVELIRPEARQLSHFRKLGWGSSVSAPAYRPVPTQARSGAYDDPFYYYWYDPYWGFAQYVMLDTMLHHGGWHDQTVVVVNPQGETLYTGDQAHSYAADPYVGSGLVSVGSDVGVSSAVPDDSSWGGSDVGSSGGGDWGGSDVHDHSWGGSDTGSSGDSGSHDSGSSGDSGSSCSSGSSCGSSCSSGSSCGSSCGGGGSSD